LAHVIINITHNKHGLRLPF